MDVKHTQKLPLWDENTRASWSALGNKILPTKWLFQKLTNCVIIWILHMVEKTPNIYPQLPGDSFTSEEEEPEPDHLKTTPEERIFGTIPGSPIATTVALMHSKAQANPIVPR